MNWIYDKDKNKYYCSVCKFESTESYTFCPSCGARHYSTVVKETIKKVTYCDECLHKKVCGLEGCGNESLTFCDDRLTESDVI